MADDEALPSRWWTEDGPSAALLLALVGPSAALLAMDVAEDLAHGGHIEHAALESLAIGAQMLAFGLVLRASHQRSQRRIAGLRAELASFRAVRPPEPAPVEPPPPEPAPPPMEPAPKPAVEATDRVEACFARWHLTRAEQEVAWLLLKGVSLQDIGAARNTSPRTARDQASAVYRKAGVAGRAELSALLLDVATEA